MKKLRFHYKMDLRFQSDVREHHVLLHCRPMELPGQMLQAFFCQTEPASALCEARDGFGNPGFSCTIRQPHSGFSVTAQGIVIRNAEKENVFHPVYRYPSAYTGMDDAMRAYAGKLLREIPETEHPLRKACVLMDGIYRELSYISGITGTKTTAGEAFSNKSGVCQDYAHILIALCRYARIPARYVAGMMVGEGASHAWAEIWDGSYWTALDPTHNCVCDERYIKLSHGRDFADAALDRGCFLGGAGQEQTIFIKVEET